MTIWHRTDAIYMPDKLRHKYRHTFRISNANCRSAETRWKRTLSCMHFDRLVRRFPWNIRLTHFSHKLCYPRATFHFCGQVKRQSLKILGSNIPWSRSQWPRGLRRRSAVARLLRLWVRILPGTRMFICCDCCVLSDRGFGEGLITRPEESYRLWCVVVCDLGSS